MKRTAMTRSTPMARATMPLRRTAMKKRSPKKRAGHDKAMLAACRGQSCWLVIPGVCRGDVATVVPCHANWADYGKGMGIKAADVYTVPGCADCHRCLDQGAEFSKEEKRAIWERAYAGWSELRATKSGSTDV